MRYISNVLKNNQLSQPSGGGAFKLFGGFQSKNSVSIVNFDPALVESRNFNVPAAAPKEPKISKQ